MVRKLKRILLFILISGIVFAFCAYPHVLQSTYRCLADCERPRIKAAEHRVIGTSLPRLSLVYELRSPPLELWSSVEVRLLVLQRVSLRFSVAIPGADLGLLAVSRIGASTGRWRPSRRPSPSAK